ncbi:MAG TPA: potassium-transporting ATPase subunit C, partial [Acidimicrobiales bacterium]|nr:potassium-transporting ATPase subunit C [Acidimicrobiales bacterium]
ELLDSVGAWVDRYRAVNGLDDDQAVPVDAVTSSGSGLDPHISVANARLQASRVARARDLDIEAVLRLVAEHTEGRSFGFLGEDAVNVLELNLALDEAR